MTGIERKQMIVDVLVVLLWKMTMVMIDLATAVQTAAATTAAVVVVVVEMMINCPLFLMKKKTQRIDCLSFLMKTTTKVNP